MTAAKRCGRCARVLPAAAFAIRRRSNDGLQARCRTCHRAGLVEHRYGLTAHEHAAMLEIQGHRCAACRELPKGARPLAVDHDHQSGRVRGLLCDACNTALGLLRDDPERIAALAAYLERTTP